MRLVRWTGLELVANLDEVLALYAAAMDYPPDIAHRRRGFISAHTHRSEFRAVATVSDEGRLLGFAYGYRSRPGQWWHDQVRAGLDIDTYRRWMSSCYELVELHVAPDVQGRGIGQTQLVSLLDGVPLRTVALSTPEGPSRAWRLYRRAGFVDVLRHYFFPGDDRAFAVLGRTLPLTSDDA